MSKEKPEFNIHSSKAQLIELVRTAGACKDQIKQQQEAIKAAKDAAKELGVEPKKFSALLTMYYLRKRDEIEQEKDELIDLYDSLFENGFKSQHDDGVDDDE